MEIVYWTAAALLLHTYLLYPLSLPVLSLFFRVRPKKMGNPQRHKVSIIIAAYNEEKVIEEKIRNCFKLEIPRKHLEILVGSDGSTDKTEAIVAKYAPDVKLYSFKQRGGKASVLNQLVTRAQGDILVFCDANTMLLKNALQKLLTHFDNPEVGCVCGRLVLQDSGTSALGIGESIYWNLESEIKKAEGRMGIVIGANGAIYAIRKELYDRIPTDRKVMDDFYVTTRVLARGRKAIYEPQAIGSEETSAEAYGEFFRKVRISQANFNLLGRYFPLLNPLRGLVAYGFFSHKFLRWIAPVLMVALFCSNAALLTHGPVYYGTFVAQVGLYFLAGLGYARNGKTRRSKLLLIPFYFVSMNVALALGMLKAIFQKDQGTWERVERSALMMANQGMQPAPAAQGMPRLQVKELSS